MRDLNTEDDNVVHKQDATTVNQHQIEYDDEKIIQKQKSILRTSMGIF